MEIKKLHTDDVDDFNELVKIFDDFSDTNNGKYQAELCKELSDSQLMVFVIKINERIAGGVIGYLLHRYSNYRPFVCIHDLALLKEFQGKFLRKLLITEVCKYCSANEFDVVFAETLEGNNERDSMDRRFNSRMHECRQNLNSGIENIMDKAKAEKLKLTVNEIDSLIMQRMAVIESQKLQIEHFAFMNAHEIRGPLATMLGLINIISNENLLRHNKELEAHLRMAAERMNAIIRQMQDRFNNNDWEGF